MSKLQSFIVILLSLLILENSKSVSQPQDSVLKAYQDTLLTLFRQMNSTTPDIIKESVNAEIVNLFSKLIQNPASFNFPFDSLKMVFREKSPDNNFRIYNWNLNYSNGTFKYFGFLQNFTKDKKMHFWQLFDKSEDIENPDNLELSPQKWYGALYYKIIPFKISKKPYFILFGWDGNNDFSKKKIIEVLSFEKNGKPKFGAPVFVNDKSIKKRVVFEFSARATMTLVYDEKSKTITFDALSPSDPMMKGKYEFYGPDGIYQGYVFKKKSWVFEPKIDARNQEIKRKKPNK